MTKGVPGKQSEQKRAGEPMGELRAVRLLPLCREPHASWKGIKSPGSSWWGPAGTARGSLQPSEGAQGPAEGPAAPSHLRAGGSAVPLGRPAASARQCHGHGQQALGTRNGAGEVEGQRARLHLHAVVPCSGTGTAPSRLRPTAPVATAGSRGASAGSSRRTMTHAPSPASQSARTGLAWESFTITFITNACNSCYFALL